MWPAPRRLLRGRPCCETAPKQPRRGRIPQESRWAEQRAAAEGGRPCYSWRPGAGPGTGDGESRPGRGRRDVSRGSTCVLAQDSAADHLPPVMLVGWGGGGPGLTQRSRSSTHSSNAKKFTRASPVGAKRNGELNVAPHPPPGHLSARV